MTINSAAAAIDACHHFRPIIGPRGLTIHFLRGSLDGRTPGSPIHMTYCGRLEPRAGWLTVRSPDPNLTCYRCLTAIASEARG
jgi:hypothetical protein